MFLTAEVRGNGQTHNDGAGPHLGFIHVTAAAYVEALELVPAPASIVSTVIPGCSSQAGGSGSSWPMFTHGCCQTSSKVPLLVGEC